MSAYFRNGFTADEHGSFGIELGRPSEDEDEWYGEPGEPAAEFELFFPHQCDHWSVACGDRAHVLAAALRFRAEFDEAIRPLLAEAERKDHE